MDQPWQIEMFGWLRAVRADQVVSRFRTRKAGALLAYLAFYHHRSHPREQLIELLWPERPPSVGRTNLRAELTSLRHQLEPPGVPPGAVLVANWTTIRLNPAACVTDVAQFEAALKASERAASAPERARHLIAAAELYRGELLPGCFEEWILPERLRLAEAFLGALHQVVALLEQLLDRPQALQWARRAVAADPLCEESQHDLIRLLVAAGQLDAARSQYERGEQLLARELGDTFSPELHALISSLPPLAGPLPLRGGKRRPGRPRRTGDLVPAPPGSGDDRSQPCDSAASVTPAAEPSPTAARPTDNLPLRFTRFFGREPEIAALVEMLSGIHHGGTETQRRDEAEIHRDRVPAQRVMDQQHREELHPDLHPVHPCEFPSVPPCLRGEYLRLVTLTGPGGSGKTRLALQVAQRLRSAFPGGVWLVSLLDLTDPALIPDQMLLALRLLRSPHREPLEQVVAFLSRAPSLLLLDNFEHLVSGGTETVQTLLEQVEDLTILVTSRQRLNLEGEREFPVGPLPVPAEGVGCGVWGAGADKGRSAGPHTLHPTPYTLLQFPSVALFVDRAQAVRPDFQVTAHNAAAVADLCQRLEGMPLAIELAAARAGVLTPQQMLARLSEPFELLVSRQRTDDPRHHSLRATLDWSYQLLTPELQRFFAQLSVFRGGWTLEAAEAVCDVGVGGWGLGVGSEPAFPTPNPQPPTPALSALEQLRETSLLLATAEGDEIRYDLLETMRHYGWDRLRESGEAEAARRRHAEYFTRLAEQGERVLMTSGTVAWWDRIEREHDNMRAALAWCAGSGVRGQEPGASQGSGARGQGLDPSADDPVLTPGPSPLTPDLLTPDPWPLTPTETGLRLAGALHRFWFDRGYVIEARTHLEAMLALPGPERSKARVKALWAAGFAADGCGDYGSGERRYEESLQLAREIGDREGIAWALQCTSGGTEESLAIFRELNHKVGIGIVLTTMGYAAVRRGEWAAARPRILEALAHFRELGHAPGVAWALSVLGQVAEGEGDLDTAWRLCQESLTLYRQLRLAVGVVDSLHRAGHVALRRQEWDGAQRFFDESLGLAQEMGSKGLMSGCLSDLGLVACGRRDWAEARARIEESLALAQQVGDMGNAAGCLETLAEIMGGEGEPEQGARLLGAAEALTETIDRGFWPYARDAHERTVAALLAALGEPALAAARAEGRKLSLEQAIDLAVPGEGGRPTRWWRESRYSQEKSPPQ